MRRLYGVSTQPTTSCEKPHLNLLIKSAPSAYPLQTNMQNKHEHSEADSHWKNWTNIFNTEQRLLLQTVGLIATLSPHFRQIFTTLSPHCGHTFVLLSPHFRHSFVTLSQHLRHISATFSPFFRRTFAPLSPHFRHTSATLSPHIEQWHCYCHSLIFFMIVAIVSH